MNDSQSKQLSKDRLVKDILSDLKLFLPELKTRIPHKSAMLILGIKVPLSVEHLTFDGILPPKEMVVSDWKRYLQKGVSDGTFQKMYRALVARLQQHREKSSTETQSMRVDGAGGVEPTSADTVRAKRAFPQKKLPSGGEKVKSVKRVRFDEDHVKKQSGPIG